MFDVVSLGNYAATPLDREEGSALENLRALTKSLCREPYRRIDRFIRLCLIGSARCVANLSEDVPLADGTGLYIASSMAAMSNNISVQQQMFVDGQLPKPVNFINTLSNSAGYYVAHNLELNSQNLFLSRGDASLEALLQMLEQDFQLGSVSQALVGVVDECVEPLELHRKRLGLDEDALLGEGSHWFLLRPSRVHAVSADTVSEMAVSNSNPVTIAPTLARITDVQTLVNEQSLGLWLESVLTEDLWIHVVPGVPLPPSILTDIDHLERYDPVAGRYGARTAGIIARFIEADDGRQLVSICADVDGRFHVLRVAKPD